MKQVYSANAVVSNKGGRESNVSISIILETGNRQKVWDLCGTINVTRNGYPFMAVEYVFDHSGKKELLKKLVSKISQDIVQTYYKNGCGNIDANAIVTYIQGETDKFAQTLNK